MHRYSLNNNYREKTLSIIFIISLVLNKFLYGFVDGIITSFSSSNSVISNIIEFFDSVGIGVNLFTLSSVFGLLYCIYDKWLWKNKWITKLHNVPNLNGCWDGGLVSSHLDENGNQTKMYAYFEIKQTWSKITIKSDFSKTEKETNKRQLTNQNSSSSYSDTATFDVDNSAGPKLIFTYRNEANEPNLQIRNHSGCNTLVYKDNTLSGKYFTDRGDGTHGTIFLMKTKNISEKVN